MNATASFRKRLTFRRSGGKTEKASASSSRRQTTTKHSKKDPASAAAAAVVVTSTSSSSSTTAASSPPLLDKQQPVRVEAAPARFASPNKNQCSHAAESSVPRQPRATSSGSQPSSSSPQQQQQATEHCWLDYRDSIAAASALDNAGNLQLERGEYARAMKSYERALEVKRSSLQILEGNNNSNNKASLSSPCQQQQQQDHYQSDEHQQLLASIATSINNIGYLKQRSGSYSTKDTMAQYEDSLKLKRQILGANHISVAKTLNNVGSVHFSTLKFGRALQSYRQALDIMQEHYLGQPDGHLDVATVLSNIADVYMALQQQRQQQQPEKDAATTTATTTSSSSSYNSATTCQSQSLLEQALEHYKQALNIRWGHLDEHSPKIRRLLEKIAFIEMNNADGALSALWNRDERYKNGNLHADGSDRLLLEDMPAELHHLHNQVEADIKEISDLRRKMALDMVKDKLRILKGMKAIDHRRLDDKATDDADNDDHDGHRSSSPSLMLPEEAADNTTTTASTGIDENDKRHNQNAALKTPPPLSPMQRKEALSSVKERLAKLRQSRAMEQEESASSSASGKHHYGEYNEMGLEELEQELGLQDLGLSKLNLESVLGS